MIKSETSTTSCKSIVDGTIIHQEIKFKHLDIKISGYGDIEAEVRKQQIATRVAACLDHKI